MSAEYIFLTGAPGSQWSAIAYVLSRAAEVNKSDEDEARRFESQNVLHFGAYYGANFDFGANFDQLHELTRDQVERELVAAYGRSGGRMIFKSHFFARHLSRLVRLFPEASLVLVERDDEACVEWWMKAGGFDIPYPDYSWYGELDNMRNEIALGNSAVRDFCVAHDLALVPAHDGLADAAQTLGLTIDQTMPQQVNISADERGPRLAVYTPSRI